MSLPRCQICKMEAEWPVLKSHLACTHAEYRPHGCVQCDYDSPDIDEMVEHSKASHHFVKLNQYFDGYKEGLVKRLIDDHLPSKNDGPTAMAILPSEVKTVAKEKSPVGKSKIDGVANAGAALVIKLPSAAKCTKKPVKISSSSNLKKPAEGGAKKARGPRKGRNCFKAPTRKKCCYPGCEAKSVDGHNSLNHIQKAHMSDAFDFPCPVRDCAQKVDGKGRLRRYRLNSLSVHICQRHGGVKMLSAEELAQHCAQRKAVAEEARRLRSVCFPSDGHGVDEGNE